MSENNMTFPCCLYSYLFSLQYYSLFSQDLHLYFFVSRMKTKTVMWYFMEVILQAGDLYLYGSSLFLFSQVLRNIIFMDPGIGELLHHFLLFFFQIPCLFSINKERGFLLGLPVLENYSEHWFGLFSILEMKFTISSCPFYLLRTFHLDFLIPKQWNNKFYF